MRIMDPRPKPARGRAERTPGPDPAHSLASRYGVTALLPPRPVSLRPGDHVRGGHISPGRPEPAERPESPIEHGACGSHDTQDHEVAPGGSHARQVHEVHRSEEHTSELQSLMRISYAVFCLKKKKNTQ